MSYQTRSYLTLLAGAVVLVSASNVFAQQEEILEEIVTTATKRSLTLQEVPVAVSVITSETIKRAQIHDVLDLQSLVPSLRVTQLQSSGNTNFLIRGFGNGANNPGIEPSVGVFIDGVYRSRSAAAISDLPNLERVEVLRGPQSTLFGKNASAGVISVITAAPSDEFLGSAEVTGGNYGQMIVKGDISGPIGDNAGFSVAAGFNQRDGFAENLASGEEYNERDRWNIRGQFVLDLTDSISLRAIADYDEIDEACCGSANIVSGDTTPVVFGVGGALVVEDPFAREAFFNYEPRNQIENSGISLQADFELENSVVTSITSFRNVSRIEDFDADFTSADLLTPNITDTDIDTFTQELRWASDSGEKMDWMFGGFFFDEDVSYDTDLGLGADTRLYADLLAGQLSGLGGTGTIVALEEALGFGAILAALEGASPGNPANIPTAQFLSTQACTPANAPNCNPALGASFGSGQGVMEAAGQSNQSFSIFAQFDFYVGDRTTLTLGVNYTEDEKDAFVSQANTSFFDTLDFVNIGFQQILGVLEAGDPGSPANVPTAQFLSMVPCSAQTGPFCNPLLGFQDLQVLPQLVNFPNAVENGNSNDDNLTWTARAAFDVNDDINIYASASTGFKATSWNLSRDSRPFDSDIAAIESAGLGTPNLVSGTRFAGPEESTVYELGFKARWDMGTLNVAIFDQSIEGFQSNIFSGVGFNLANAGKQSTTGIEIDAVYSPSDSVQFTFGGIFMDPIYDSFVDALGPDGRTDLSGMKPAGIHEISVSTSATYSGEFGNGTTWYFRGEFIFEDEVQVVDNVAKEIASREVNLFNASYGLSTESGWDFSVWGRNLTDDEYLLSAFPSVFQEGSLSGYPNAPRTYGVTVRKSF
jgi:iron complex outermembrane receptor protein